MTNTGKLGNPLGSVFQKYQVRKPDGSLGGLSIAKIFADGNPLRKVEVKLLSVGSIESSPAKPIYYDNTEKLNGEISINDVNYYRKSIDINNVISENDLKAIKEKTELEFSS